MGGWSLGETHKWLHLREGRSCSDALSEPMPTVNASKLRSYHTGRTWTGYSYGSPADSAISNEVRLSHKPKAGNIVRMRRIFEELRACEVQR